MLEYNQKLNFNMWERKWSYPKFRYVSYNTLHYKLLQIQTIQSSFKSVANNFFKYSSWNKLELEILNHEIIKCDY